MQGVAVIEVLYPAALFHLGEDGVAFVQGREAFKGRALAVDEALPLATFLLYHGGDDFVGLGKVVVQQDVLEPLGDAPPAVHLLLGQTVYVVADFLVADEHQVQLLASAAVTFLRKVLQHLGVAHRGLGDVGLQILAELVVHYVDAVVSLLLYLGNHVFVQLHHVKAQEGVEAAA